MEVLVFGEAVVDPAAAAAADEETPSKSSASAPSVVSGVTVKSR